MRKIIVYVSGIDGCGKTTQAKILVEELRVLGYTYSMFLVALEAFNCELY